MTACAFPNCPAPRARTKSGSREYAYCAEHNTAYMRWRYTASGVSLSRKGFEREVASGAVSVSALTAMTFDKKHPKRETQRTYAEVMETIAQLPPAPEPRSLTPYTATSKTRTVSEDDLSVRFRVARERCEALIVARGGTVRQLREMDDAERAAATVRLGALLAAGMERSA